MPQNHFSHCFRFFGFDYCVKSKLDCQEGQVRFVGQNLLLSFRKFIVANKFKKFWQFVRGFTQTLCIMSQGITVKAGHFLTKFLPLSTHIQPSLLRPILVVPNRFRCQQVTAKRIVANRPTCFTISIRSPLQHHVSVL